MAKSKSSLSKNNLLTALLYVLVGVMFIVFRGSMLKWGLTIIGALAIVYGIFLIASKQVVAGIIYMLVGIAIIVGAWLYFGYVILIIGALLIVRGVIDLIQGTTKKKANAINILIAILTIIVGILLIVSKWVVLDWFFIIVGAVLIVDGVLALFGKKPVK
ncbi:MAG: DUF308 domain-containing protein [Clostridia bacterium]|nr:DUF308 domain-containing protein [Clostridia bacterium]